MKVCNIGYIQIFTILNTLLLSGVSWLIGWHISAIHFPVAFILSVVILHCFRKNIIKDVNQALAKTVIYKMPTKITADTLQVFKSNLQINQLKETSYPHLDCGNLEIYDNNRLCLSRKGIFVSDGIISDLMFVEE